MTVPFRTFAAFGLALGMIGLGYQFGPAPGATPLPSQPVAKAVPAAATKPANTLVASRPPVPLVTPPRASYLATVDGGAAASAASTVADKPTVDMGTFSANPTEPTDTTQALAMAGDDAQAKRAIEFDGYKNPRALAKGPDGLWHGRAMRGRTEVAIRVDASGNVSAE